MQTVTYQTAIKLKEAGFPHPDNQEELVLWETEDECVEYMATWEATDPEEEHEWVYTPTATDLLPEGWALFHRAGEWEAIPLPIDKRPYRPFLGEENPAEAAAKAWLYVNSK